MTRVEPPEPLPDWVYRLSQRRSAFFSLAVTAACLALATAARAGLGLIDPNLIFFATYYPAILAVTLLAGAPWGTVTMVSGWLLAWYLFVPPRFELKPLGLTQLLSMSLYAMSAALLIIMGEAHRRLLGRLQVKRQRLMAEKEHSELLLKELNHRAKNTLTVISSIVSQSLKADRSSAERILGRLRAYATNDTLVEPRQSWMLLEDILRRETASHAHQVSLSGPEIRLTGEVGQAVSMVIHELTTNAVKHGALSTPGGAVTVTWTGASDDQVELDWQERDGPPVSQPQRLGFGSFLIERLLQDNGGKSVMAFNPQGLTCRLMFASASEVIQRPNGPQPDNVQR